MNRTRWIPTACALALVLATAPGCALELEERLEKTYDLGPGGTVTLVNANGAVAVEGWDRDEVRVEAVKKVRAASRDRAEEALKRLEVEIERRGDRLEIRTVRPERSSSLFGFAFGGTTQGEVTYTLSVPRRTDLEVKTTNGRVRVAQLDGRVEARSTNGAVEVRQVKGAVETRTTNGAVVVEDVRGSLEASTTNGAIRAELQEVAEGRSMRLRTTNGSIRLTLPRSARVSVEATTTNGGISLDDLPADVRSKTRRRLEADVNGGGPTLRLSTTNGGIRISGR